MPVQRQSHNFVGSNLLNSKRRSSTTSAAWIRPSGSKIAQLNRLVISDTSEKPNLADGNALVEWNEVRCVDILTDFAPTCPICLDQAFLPQMLECGHSFCLPCILIHFSSACSCCVCSEFARPGDLRSIRVQLVSPVCAGTNRSFELIRTYRGVSVPSGSREDNIPSDDSIGWWFSRAVTRNDAKTRRFHLGEFERLCETFKSPPAEGIHSLGKTFAAEFLRSRIASIGEPSVASPTNRSADEDEGYVKIDFGDLSLLSQEEFPLIGLFAYQLVDGQHVYLEPVWMRALLHHYTGDSEGWNKLYLLPRSISLPIVHASGFTVDFETRKRFKFISHLPLGSDVVLCDVDVRAIVRLETLEALAVPISRRLEIIKKVKAQRKSDKRDVRRANAVPLSEEWSLASGGHYSTPEKVPSEEDFVPLPSSGSKNFPEPSMRGTYASIAANLQGHVFEEPAVRRVQNEDDALLAQYALRTSADHRKSEIDQAIERVVSAGSKPEKTKRAVKLRIAG